MRWLAAISIILVLAGCQGKPNEESAPAIEVDLAPAPQETAEKVAPLAPEPVQRKLVKNGRIEFETADAAATRENILRAVKAVNGYVGEDNEERSSSTISYTMVVRVPTGRFETFLASATKNVADFKHKSISNEDVSFRSFVVVLIAIWPFLLLAVGATVAINSWQKRQRKAAKPHATEIPSE